MAMVTVKDPDNGEAFKLNVVRIVSTHKRLKIDRQPRIWRSQANTRVHRGYKRIQAIVKTRHGLVTRHIDVPQDFTA